MDEEFRPTGGKLSPPPPPAPPIVSPGKALAEDVRLAAAASTLPAPSLFRRLLPRISRLRTSVVLFREAESSLAGAAVASSGKSGSLAGATSPPDEE